MNLFYPFYYQNFKCIGGACKHSCCIGWEIDIDRETYEKYQGVSGEIGERLSRHISIEETPHFILEKEERCPFLNKDNLCDIILEKGEDYLCQICTDHPRFRNYFTNCIEVGIGLACEEAARLILSQKEPFFMPEKDAEILTAEEKPFFRFRRELLTKVTNRQEPFFQRILSLCQGYGILFPEKSHQEWAGIFLSLEHLDNHWIELLKQLQQTETMNPLQEEWDLPLEQLFCCFIYRHLAGGLEDGSYGERILFACLAVVMISFLASLQQKTVGNFTMDDFVELVRLYSSEIEYSEENTQMLLDVLATQ